MGRVREKSSKQSHLVRGMREGLGMEIVQKRECGKGKQKIELPSHECEAVCLP